MNTQVCMELLEQFKKELSFYKSSSEESNIDRLRPHLKKAGKNYFKFVKNEKPNIKTTDEFLVEPFYWDKKDSSGRGHQYTEAYDQYWICVLGLLGRCGYIFVKDKKLREMKIPTVSTSQGIKADWSAYFLHGIGPEEGFLLNERDYIIDVCEASIQASNLLINEYGETTEKSTVTNIIEIDANHFSNGKTWTLLTQIINDAKREGVKCDKPRTPRTLKERLKDASKNHNKPQYRELAKSLKYKNGVAYTEIPCGRIIILPKRKKNSAL